MVPLQGQWVATEKGWQTSGERPPAGWYLRSQRQYDLGCFSFEIKKNQPDDLVFVYLKDWQICLRPDSVTVRYAALITGNFRGVTLGRPWGSYWYTATRPLSFRSGDWKAFQIELVDGGIVVRSGKDELVRFSSPEKEWGERVRKSGRFAAFEPYVYPEGLEGYSTEKQVLIVHAYGKGLSLRKVSVDGKDAGAAENFYAANGKAKAEAIPAEEDLPLLRPQGVLDVNWKLEAAESARIEKHAKVSEWKVSSGDFVKTSDEGAVAYPEIMEYGVGLAQPGKVPQCLRWRVRYKTLPQECRFAFNLAAEGVYTFQLGWQNMGMGWGPDILEISVDGKPVVLEEYRALMKYESCSPGMESIPMKLAAGAHRIDVRLVTDRFGNHVLMKLLKFPVGSVRLVKGEDIPWKTVDIRKPGEATQKSPATEDPFTYGEWNGPELNYRMTGLAANGAYTVKLYFADFETVDKGSRVMSVSVNGKTVEKALDIFAEKGWGALLEKSYAATASHDGKIEIRLLGGRRKAVVNGIRVFDAKGAEVFKENFGWHPSIPQFIKRMQDKIATPRLSEEAVSAEPPKWTPQEVFDGHNVVANSHFSLADSEREGKPGYWYSFRELIGKKIGKINFVEAYRLHPGSGEYALDGKVGREHLGALRIGKIEEDFALTCNLLIVDPSKRQRFSFFVKGEKGAAPVRASIVWLAHNRDAEENGVNAPLHGPLLQKMGIAQGQSVIPDGDWKEVFVEAKPPKETIYALVVVEAEKNGSASIWVDDAELNGYGAEPLEITRSFLGFHPQGDKTMVVKSFSSDPVSWQIKRLGGNDVVARGEIKESQYEWFSKRHYFLLDASALKEPGDYSVVVTQGKTTVTDTIKIDAGVYRGFALTMMNALRARRINCEIENVRDPEMLDYAAAVKVLPENRFVSNYEPLCSRERIDLTGGYYDAGDDIVHTEFWPCVMAATVNAVASADKDKELREKSASEENWILSSFQKYTLDDGTLIASCKPQAYLLDNVPLYSYDPIAGESHNVTQTAGTAAMAAYAVRDTNPALSRRYVEIAEENYRATELWKVIDGAREIGPKETSAAAKALWAEMYLNKLTRSAEYSSRMAKSAETLARGLKNRSYDRLLEMSTFQGSQDNGGVLQDCVWVAVLFAREYPDHPATAQLKEGLRAFADHVAQLSAKSVWGQSAALNSPEGLSCRFPAYGGYWQGYWAMLAHNLAQVGMLLKDEKIIRLAERQLQWCLGRNMADVSMVQGVGHYIIGGSLSYTRDVYFNHWLNSPGQDMIISPGQVPSAGFRDVGNGKLLSESGAKRHIPMPYLFPSGYCILPTRSYYGTQPGRFPVPSEDYLPLVAQYNLAASSVYAALKSLEK